MITFKLLLRSAPGVIAISLLLTMVVVVICSGLTANAASDTVTCSVLAPMANWKCRTGAAPEATTISWEGSGLEPAVRVSGQCPFEIRGACFNEHLGPLDRPMIGIVHHPANRSHNRAPNQYSEENAKSTN